MTTSEDTMYTHSALAFATVLVVCPANPSSGQQIDMRNGEPVLVLPATMAMRFNVSIRSSIFGNSKTTLHSYGVSRVALFQTVRACCTGGTCGKRHSLWSVTSMEMGGSMSSWTAIIEQRNDAEYCCQASRAFK